MINSYVVGLFLVLLDFFLIVVAVVVVVDDDDDDDQDYEDKHVKDNVVFFSFSFIAVGEVVLESEDTLTMTGLYMLLVASLESRQTCDIIPYPSKRTI